MDFKESQAVVKDYCKEYEIKYASRQLELGWERNRVVESMWGDIDVDLVIDPDSEYERCKEENQLLIGCFYTNVSETGRRNKIKLYAFAPSIERLFEHAAVFFQTRWKVISEIDIKVEHKWRLPSTVSAGTLGRVLDDNFYRYDDERWTPVSIKGIFNK